VSGAGCGAGCGTRCAADTPSGPVPIQLGRRPVSGGAVPWYHLLAGDPPLVLLVANSAVFEVAPEFFDQLAAGEPRAVSELAAVGRSASSVVGSGFDEVGPLPAPRAISLNVAQACNLACAYCYADEGRFGGSARRMSQAVARQAVDALLAGAVPGERVLVGFIGGEPLLNRAVMHDTVAYASTQADARSVAVAFSVTTNGTLVEAADIELFRSNPFAVTVSLDGDAVTHDRHRRGHDGRGSWARALQRLRPLLDAPGQARLTARATVTREDLDVARRVAALAAVGFSEVGVSPARTGPNPGLLLRGSDWVGYLCGLVEAGEAELARLRRSGSSGGWLFSNLGIALSEIHRGAARPLPCGAGYGYVSVDVTGAYATCHRTVGDPRFHLGTAGALSDVARREFLEPRLVDRQEPCRSCWARYLCGGGCHAEVAQVGRESCDAIRGWLEYCLRRYPLIHAEFPQLFRDASVVTSEEVLAT
jgi:uncharacterized protein